METLTATYLGRRSPFQLCTFLWLLISGRWAGWTQHWFKIVGFWFLILCPDSAPRGGHPPNMYAILPSPPLMSFRDQMWKWFQKQISSSHVLSLGARSNPFPSPCVDFQALLGWKWIWHIFQIKTSPPFQNHLPKTSASGVIGFSHVVMTNLKSTSHAFKTRLLSQMRAHPCSQFTDGHTEARRVEMTCQGRLAISFWCKWCLEQRTTPPWSGRSDCAQL